MRPGESHYVRYYKRLGECAKLATSYIAEAFLGKVDPTAQNHGFGSWGFGEVKGVRPASDT